MYIKILLLTVVLLAIAFVGIAIKMFVKKGGEFKKQCSSVNPDTGQILGCSCEGAPNDGSCKKEENKYPVESPVVAKIKELRFD